MTRPPCNRHVRDLRVVSTLVLAALALSLATTTVAAASAARRGARPVPPVPPAPAVATETQRDPWQDARRLADAGEYDAALAVLRAALVGKPGEFGLRWLEAGITGEAGRHREAVALYVRLADDQPARAGELRADLAAQRLAADDPAGAARDYRAWISDHAGDRDARGQLALSLARADSLRPALAEYDLLLRSGPMDTDAALGRARVLAWMGRNDDAIRAYRAVLVDEPANRDAALGLAMNQNWAGLHRTAARGLAALTQRADADPEAFKALAFARYWDDDPDAARAALDAWLRHAPGDAEGRALARRLARERRASLRCEFGRADDSDGLRVDSPALELSLPLSAATTLLAGWRDDLLHDSGGKQRLRRVSVGLREHVSPAWSAYGRVTPAGGSDGVGMPVLGELGVVSRPLDRTRFEAVVAREPVLTRRSAALGISLLDWAGAVTLTPRERLTLDAVGRAGYFSDGNRSERLAASAGWKAFTRAREDLTVRLATEQFHAHRDPGHGYYAPAFHREWGPGLDGEWRPDEDRTFGASAQYGWQHDKGGDTSPFFTCAARAEMRIREAWMLELQAGRGDSSLQDATGYDRTFWQAAITLGF